MTTRMTSVQRMDTSRTQPAHQPRTWLALTLACTMVALSACGSFNGDDPPVATIPVSSIEAFTGYVAGQPANDDLSSPVDVEGLVPPTSETAEPALVT